MCEHQTACPSSEASDREAARPVAYHPERRSLLCNGVLLFDTGELLPNGRAIGPHRPFASSTAHGSGAHG